ncbi:hypothetical protein BC332_16645 [Capsicum chinense]|nr:hypothetical protein BC332_16645 [Capsicum chinense]
MLASMDDLFTNFSDSNTHWKVHAASSADIDPIGSISKMDLRTFQKWASVHLGSSSLAEIEAPPPTAEVEPIC